MLLLPAAALCCLCSAMVATAAEELIQDQLSLTRRVGQSASFTCEQTQRCDTDYVRWYQKKETFTLILRIRRSSGAVEKGYGHPQKDDFSAVNIQNGCELKIDKVKLSHSASYYCICEKYDPHSEKRSLQPEQKPSDELMSNSVSDRKTAGNHSPGSQISPPAQTLVLDSSLILIHIWMRYFSSFPVGPHSEDEEDTQEHNKKTRGGTE
ncbi:uncharacterized protein LOC115057914 [Echeneis naucrates]|uniref:uncharacterized protein LOC115057914 n=1 Tax=Echeneis naucrates TaxID=173247 RepID=UPI001113B481|nr:uncharacterized protein LOC115057914 [Echeneis naucrates]